MLTKHWFSWRFLALYLPELYSRILVCRSQAVPQLPALWSLRHAFGKGPRLCCAAWFCHVDGYRFTIPIAAREWLTFFLDWNDVKVQILSSFYKMSNSVCLKIFTDVVVVRYFDLKFYFYFVPPWNHSVFQHAHQKLCYMIFNICGILPTST